MSVQQRFGDVDVPECRVDGCNRDAEWRLTCTDDDYEGETVRCDDHREEPQPFFGAYGCWLQFDRERVTVDGGASR